MRFFKIVGSVFCLTAIVLICILAASVFNTELSERLKTIGDGVMTAISEFSEKAEINAFSEADR